MGRIKSANGAGPLEGGDFTLEILVSSTGIVACLMFRWSARLTLALGGIHPPVFVHHLHSYILCDSLQQQLTKGTKVRQLWGYHI